MKDILYICVKNPFVERDLDRMGIVCLQKHFDVRILDCTAWLLPAAFDARGEQSMALPNLRSIHSLREFRQALDGDSKGYALDYVGQFSLRSVLMFEALRAAGIPIIVIDSGAYPSPADVVRRPGLIEKLRLALREGGLRTHINARLVKGLLSILPDQRPDIALVAGSSWRAIPRFRDARRHVAAHSFDYESFLRVCAGHAESEHARDYIVYLDENITEHEDNAEVGLKQPASKLLFGPSINRFFDAVEQATSLPIIIAGYPTSHPSRRNGEYGGRELIFGRTPELIRNARLVFAHASTALSFGVLWQRPLVFLTSKEIRQSWYHPWIVAPQKILGAPLVDIDENLVIPENWTAWLYHNKVAYADYQNTYIKTPGSPDCSIWEILAAACADMAGHHYNSGEAAE